MDSNLIYQVGMHGEWVPKVEGLGPLLEELLQLVGEIGRSVDTQDLRRARGIPSREEGHLKPFVVFLSSHILRAVVMGVVVHFPDHLD